MDKEDIEFLVDLATRLPPSPGISKRRAMKESYVSRFAARAASMWTSGVTWPIVSDLKEQ